MKKVFFRRAYLLGFIFMIMGCSIKLGPEPVQFTQFEDSGLVRLGQVQETVTGTWNIYPTSGIKNEFLTALKKPEVEKFFNGGISSYVMDIQLTSDHEADGSRLASLGTISMLTLGIIPLKYHSEWNVQCKVSLKSSEGDPVGEYSILEKGSYDIWVYPLTMLSLSGAGARGEADGTEVFRRISESLVRKIMDTIAKDYETLASQAGTGGAKASSFTPLQKNIIV